MANSSAIKAGRAFVELFADDSKLVSGLKRAKARLSAFGAGIGVMGGRLMGAGAAAAVPFGLGAREFAAFETQMSNIATLLDEPAKHMDGFAKGIKRMAMETGQETATLAKGLYDLISSSVDPAKAMDVLGQSAMSAKAGVTDVATSTAALINIMNAYHVPAERVSEVSDMMFLTVKRGVLTFEELAGSIGVVTATGNAAGLGMDELGAAMATMTRNGLKSEIAVTALQNVLAEFLKPSAEGAAIARQYGVELSTASLKSEGFLGVMQKLAKVSPEDLAKIFPDTRGLRGILAIRGDMEGFTTDVGLMGKKAGATAKAYSMFEGNLTGSFKRIKQIGLVSLQSLGEAISEPLKALADWLEVVGKSVVEWIGRNKAMVQAAAAVVVGVLATGAALLVAGKMISVAAAGIGAVISVISILKTVLGVVVPMILGLLSPVGLVIAACIALTGVILKVSGVLDAAFQWISEGFQGLADDCKQAFGAIGNALAKGDIGAAVRVLWLTVKLEWAKGMSAIQTLWADFKMSLKVVWEGISSALSSIWLDCWYGLRQGWAAFVNWHQSTVETWAGWLAKRMIEVNGLMDDSVNVEQQKGFVDASVKQNLAAIDQQHAKEKAKIADEQKFADGLAEAAHRDELVRISKERDATVNGLDEEVAKARGEWQKALAEANKPPVREPRKGFDGEGAMKAVKAGMEDIAGAPGAKTSAIGTFNAAALQGLAGGGVPERTAKATEATAKNTKTLVDNAWRTNQNFA